ncbi:hypothetical protein L3X38_008823 [Prunus dulcis]|uniref:RNase H type-1 domain-containing protein n=1 Tax=Prunus dulcis TaxID=3755 RepID=A0AAD4ZX74_PRUDU|nr:hypothetical protein L3X38_008823 [Prunus dulcis]
MVVILESRCLTVIAHFCWQIWKDRCKAVLEHISPSPARTTHAASIAINEFLGSLDHGRHQTEHPTLSNDNQQQLWNPPASPFVKVNVDASWNPNSKRVGIGILIRNTHGDFIKGSSIPSVANSAIEAEAQACLEGCKLAAEMGFHQTYVWTWIPRTANQAADHLAMLAISRMSPEVWVNRPPSSLMHILNKDGLPCPPRSA